MTTEQRSGIITPEAVVLEFETAGVGSRTIARIVDLAVIGISFYLLAIVVSLVSVPLGDSGTWVLVAFSALVVFGGLVLYPILMEALWGGRTLGKAAMGLRVVTKEGAPARIRHTFVRGTIGLVEVFMFGFIAVLTCAVSRSNQRVGDLAGGTIVLRERKADAQAVAVQFPAPWGLEWYVASLDVSALTEEQYALIRSFLMRVQQLVPEARIALAVRLANPVALRLHHTPPTQVGPEVFLACVASAYQRRHGVSGYAGYGVPGAYGAPPPPPMAWPPSATPATAGYPPQPGYPAAAGYPPAGSPPPPHQ